MAFKPVKTDINFPELEREILAGWNKSGLVQKYLHKNDASKTQFSFLDGPITANNPMGVHHAWGRSYKDLWQRYHTMQGDRQRYQNGFDCQGLWVEVEVEKELGFKNKKEIESYGIANFVNKCKERVLKYAAIQTEQSKRLGYFMDWENSYFTESEENNYAIWHFLKVCWERNWIYKGHDSVPWCPRCETAISQHEMLTEDYKEVVHESIYLKLPLTDRPDESLLVWTTTPWTIPANIAVAVDEKVEYALVEGLWVAKSAISRVFGHEIKPDEVILGKKLLGLKYKAPYDYLDAVTKVSGNPKFHIVVPTDSRIMPISESEGTGLVHTAVSAGQEDFKLGKKLGLPVIPVIADNANYLPGLGDLSDKNAKKHPEIILDFLKDHGWAWKTEQYKHRYPACWRCKTELVWKVADEWYIHMDVADDSGLTLRKQMMKVARKITWQPSFGRDRELDWLKNMHDWLISKKNRYWGLALPIYECPKCGHFEILGSKDELHSRAVEGWDKFAGNTPHRPWVDEVKIKCSQCGEIVSRIKDVGNPWLDAGIVPFSTLPPEWFPADFITESFPGQFKNWFYSLIAMGTVLAKTNPMKTVLGFALACGSDGEIMHKSNPKTYISFDEAADKAGSDVMRWTFARQNPSHNLLFSYGVTDEIRRQFHLILWNVYNYFVTYANLDHFDPAFSIKHLALSTLDKWILARLQETVNVVTKSLDNFDAFTASHAIECFVNDLSLWYVRRSRERDDRVTFLSTLHQVLTTLAKLMAPINPFISEEIYKNLTGEESVHLSSWPSSAKASAGQAQLLEDMKLVRKIVELGLAARKDAQIKVRQPLRLVTVNCNSKLADDLLQLIKDELNVKEVILDKGEELSVTLDSELSAELIEEGRTRELMRQVQDLRKKLGVQMNQYISLVSPYVPADVRLIELLKKKTLAKEVKSGSELAIELL